jgi:hypothetical protein
MAAAVTTDMAPGVTTPETPDMTAGMTTPVTADMTADVTTYVPDMVCVYVAAMLCDVAGEGTCRYRYDRKCHEAGREFHLHRFVKARPVTLVPPAC